MNQDQQEKAGPESLLVGWMKSAMDFWASTANMWPEASQSTTFSESQGKLQSTLEMWQTLFSALGEPAAMESVFKGVHTIPEIALKMTTSTWNGYFYLQQQWLERIGQIGEQTEAYRFENLDKEMFKAWMEVYERDFRQFLNVPQIGLTRFYQEKATRMLDRFNIFQAAASEFMYLLYLPMEKSLKVMQDELKTLTEKGELSDNFNDYYRKWIKILEGHYMTLFKSQEFAQSLNNTVNAMQNFKKAKEDLVVDVLKTLPIPTNKDMDELYKEIYLLKKRVRELTRKLGESVSELNLHKGDA